MPTRPAKGARIVRSSSRASAALRWALGGGDRAFQRLHLGRQVLDLGAGAGAGAAERLGAFELDGDFVPERLGAAGLGDGLLDLGAALGGIELDQHVAGLDLLALVEADLADDACHLGGHRDRFIGTHRADRFPDLDDASGLDRVDLDRRRARRTAAAAAARTQPACWPAGWLTYAPITGTLAKWPPLIGVPAAKACCPQHGDDSELTGHTHARSLLSLSAYRLFSRNCRKLS